MANIRIKIGAAVDPRIGDQIFAPIVAASQKARKAIRDGLAGGVTDAMAATNPYRSPARKSTDPVVIEAQERERLLKQAHRDIEREMRRHQNRAQRIADGAALRVSSGAVRNMSAGLSRGAGVANDLARGAGIDFSLGGALKSRIDLERQATDVSNSGLLTKEQGGKGANLIRQDPQKLMREAQQTAIATGNTTEDVMGGLSAFVAKTGDLKMGRDILADMAKLSTATGSNMADVVSAAGDISLALGDVEDKAAAIDAIMRVSAGQGKLGSIEQRDMASKMAKIAPRAGQFEGDTASTIASLGALAQMAKASGGAGTAAEAVTSVGSWTNTFSKGARRKEFKNAGVQIENDKGQLLDPETIIRNSLKATGGKTDKIGKLFADVAGQRTIRPWQNIYNKAGGGEAGDKAVHEEFQRMKGADMSKAQVQDQFDTAMKTMARQANVVAEITKRDLGDALAKAAPALIDLAMSAAKIAPAFAEITAWAASNPFAALGGLVAGSITKSLASEAMRAVTEKAVGALAGQMAVAGASTMKFSDTGMSAMGKFAAAAGIAAVALGVFYEGMQKIDEAFAKKEADENARSVHSANAPEAVARLKRAQRAAAKEEKEGGKVSPKTQSELTEATREAQHMLATLGQDSAKLEKGPGMVATLAGGITTGVADLTGNQDMKDAVAAEQLLAARQALDLAAQMAELKSVLAGEINVRVVNQPSAGVSGDGRTDTAKPRS